jgi:hypothetical protein
VSQFRVTAHFVLSIVPQHSVYITLFTYQTGKIVGGRIRTLNTAHEAGQLVLTPSIRTSPRGVAEFPLGPEICLNKYFVTGEDHKAVFSITGDTLIKPAQNNMLQLNN